MNLNNTIANCAKESGLHTYFYVRRGEVNVRLDDAYDYPVLLRMFEERITPGRLHNQRRRTTTLFFCDSLGLAEPDTATEVLPIISKMEDRAFGFFERLRAAGVEVDIAYLEPFAEKFDVLCAGVRCEVTMTYNQC